MYTLHNYILHDLHHCYGVGSSHVLSEQGKCNIYYTVNHFVDIIMS